MSLFSILVDIAARTSSIESGLTRANEYLEHFGDQAREVGERVKGALEFAGIAVGLGEVIHKFDEFIEHAAHLEQTSQKVGVTVEQLSGLEFAAKKAGVGADQLSSGLEKFAKSAEAATSGTGKQAAAFAAIGVAVRDSSGHLKPMNDLLLEVADKFEGYKDSIEKTALAQILFGRAGAELIPLLNEGRSGIESYTARLKELGGLIDEKTAKAAEAFHQKLQDLNAVGQAFWSTVAAQLLPSLTVLTDQLIKGASGVNKFAGETQPLITGLKLLVDVGYSVYRTFIDVGTAIGALSAAAVAFGTGRFREAVSIYKEHLRDLEKNQQEGNEFLRKLWSDTGDVIVAVADEVNKDTTSKKPAPIISSLEDTKTLAEQVMDLLNEIDNKSHSDFGARSVDLGVKASDEAIRELEKRYKQFLKANEDGKQPFDEIQAFADQAARNIQTSFANFLFDPFQKGLKGMLAGFIDIIRRMVAEALAANILQKLFGAGDKASGGSGLGGLLGGLITTGIGAYFGGGPDVALADSEAGAAADQLAGSTGFHFAAGGRPPLGQPSLVGEKGPELFVPDTAGSIMPNSMLSSMGGGGHTFNNTYNIDARGADAERIMTIMPTLLAQTAAKAKRDILSAFERGGYAAPRTA